MARSTIKPRSDKNGTNQLREQHIEGFLKCGLCRQRSENLTMPLVALIQ
jgi:hypothetical protein